jgi:hypothetical protein
MTRDSDTEELLQILEARGQEFLESFTVNNSICKRKRVEDWHLMAVEGKQGKQMQDRIQHDFDFEEEEWNGCEIESSEESSETKDNGVYPTVSYCDRPLKSLTRPP